MRNKKSDRIETILTEVVLTQCGSSSREPVNVYITNNSPDNPNELFVQVEQGNILLDFTISKDTLNLMRTLIEQQEQQEQIIPPPQTSDLFI